MKRILALLLTLSMLFALTACGENDKSAPTGESAGETTSTTEAPHTHSYSAATCTRPATCICGKTEGTMAEHQYDKNGICTYCNSVSPEYKELVNFSDKFLENEIKTELGLSHQEQINKSNLLQLREIRIESTVTSLEGLEYAENLETIHFDTKAIKDYSPLYNLKNLKNIYVGLLLQGIDLTFLKELNYVEYLYIISEPTVESYKYLLTSPVLKELYFSVDWNNDISFLSNGKNIEKLTLSCNMSSDMDISVLLNLPKLKELSIYSYTSHGTDVPSSHKVIYEKLINNNVIVDIE